MLSVSELIISYFLLIISSISQLETFVYLQAQVMKLAPKRGFLQLSTIVLFSSQIYTIC